MLTPADAISVDHVLNLLRDTYIQVVLRTLGGHTTTEANAASIFRRHSRLRGQFGRSTAAVSSSNQRSEIRPSSGVHVFGRSEIARILSSALEQARTQQRRLSSWMTIGGQLIFLIDLAALAVDWIMQRRANPGSALLALYDTNDGFALRTHLYGVGGIMVRRPLKHLVIVVHLAT